MMAHHRTVQPRQPDSPGPLSYPALIVRKVRGCYREFGTKETLRRMVKECVRSLKACERSLDLSVVTGALSVGAAPRSTQALYELGQCGYTAIIDLRAERKVSDLLARESAIPVCWLPTYDDWRPKPDSFFSSLETHVEKAFSTGGHARVFICCGAGEHRAPLAGVAALVSMGYPLDHAVTLVRQARPVTEILSVYFTSLSMYLERKNNGF